jgi:acetyl esterase/lipase
MRDALRGAGVPATLLELPGVGHSFPALESSGPPGAGCTITAFLDRWLRGR